MNPNVTIPQLDPLPIPSPPGLLWFLLMLGFLLHLLPMNFVLGGTPIALVARWRSRDGQHPHETTLVAWFAKALPVAIAAAVTFGVVPLLFVQALYGRLFFTSAVLMARWWCGRSHSDRLLLRRLSTGPAVAFLGKMDQHEKKCRAGQQPDHERAWMPPKQIDCQ